MRNIALTVALFSFFTLFFLGNPWHAVQAQAPESFACKSIADPTKRSDCNSCMGDANNLSTWTAVGCITTDPEDLLGTLLQLGIGVAGGIAFLLILFGGLQIMTSAGNPEQLNAGRELTTSAITGLLLIIFSVFLLQFIGVNIIGIPGFG